MIDFELPKGAKMVKKVINGVAVKMFRDLARHYDTYEHEHDECVELKPLAAMMAGTTGSGGGKSKSEGEKKKNRGFGVSQVVGAEELAFGDCAFMLAVPGSGLGNAALTAVGTDEQKEKFGKQFIAMAITEPSCGSDSSAIRATAELDEKTNEWILNGEKIFVTAGQFCDSVVVWASIDRSKGRAAIKSFIVEKGTPGITVARLEDKLGIRASDTATIVLEDCRIPYDNILGSAEIAPTGGFKGVMKTFDNTRPLVAAMAVGVSRAALEFTKEKLEEEGYTFPYDRGRHQLSAIQSAIIDMEAQLDAAKLLTYKAASMLDTGERNSLEASMAKCKAGRAGTLITQKCVELLGSMGYSEEWLLEKWMRDVKINDIYEGTGQIQMLIIARTILDYDRNMLK